MPFSAPKFTGERYIPGLTSRRIAKDHLARYEFAIPFVKGKRVLDIACGVGFGSDMCVRGGASAVDGVDVCNETIGFAARSYVHPLLRFIIGDIATYEAPVPYDIILCFETIEHIDDYDAALRNLWLLLKPGGTLLISSPNRILTSPHARSADDAPKNRFHAHEFVVEELQSILSMRGFVVAANAIYGQRQQWYVRGKILRRVYEALFATKRATSARVTPVTNKMPRYFVLAVSKPCELMP